MIPTAVLKFGEASQGPPPDQVAAAMEQGDPPIYLQRLGPPDRLGGDSLNLTETGTETVVCWLREVLSVEPHLRTNLWYENSSGRR